VPAVSLRGDRVVVVKDNTYEPVEDEAGQPFGLGEFIKIFLQEFPAVLVVDIDGLEQGAAQFDALGDLPSGGPQVWWDAAARDHTDVINILTAGADRAVVSTRDLRSLDELEAAVQLTENLIFQVVTRGREVVASRKLSKAGTAADLVAHATRAGVEEVLLLDTARPLGGEVAWDFVAHVGAPAKSLYVGGGISAAPAAPLAPPPGLKVDGLVVDLISVLGGYM
jgi:hypothetical protein